MTVTELSVSDESDTAFRPLEEMKSSDYDISHRRDVEEIDAELVRGTGTINIAYQ